MTQDEEVEMTRTTERSKVLSERKGLGGAPSDSGRSERSERPEALGQRLTHRERQIMTLMLQGLTSGGVADQLGVTRHTVEVHLCGIYDKLGARSRVQAIEVAACRGLLPRA